MSSLQYKNATDEEASETSSASQLSMEGSNSFAAEAFSSAAGGLTSVVDSLGTNLDAAASSLAESALGALPIGVGAAAADPERAALDERYGKEVVDVWMDRFVDHAFSGDHQLQVIGKKLLEAKGRFDNATKVVEAVDALQGINASSPPSEGLRLTLKLFSLVSVFCNVAPGFKEFLLFYEVALDEVIGGVDRIIASLRELDHQGIIVIHPEAHPGGAALHSYMIKVFDTNAPVPVTAAIMAWVKDNHTQLEFITGADPGAERKEFGGIDMLWPDREDPEFVAKFLFVARGPVKRYVYGHLALNMTDYRRSPAERYPQFSLKDLFI